MIPNSVVEQESFISREGYDLRLDELRWKLSRDRTLELEWAAGALNESIRESFTRVMVHYAVKFAPGTTVAANLEFKSFAKYVIKTRGAFEVITPADIINYLDHVGEAGEPRVGRLAGILRHWSSLRLPGLDSGVVPLLDGWRLKGAPKGVAVQTMCPWTGPLSELEHQALCASLVDAFAAEEIAIEDFVLVDLLIATGRRPVQLGDLKLRDILRREGDSGAQEVILNVPRRKQGGPWRTEFKPIFLSPEKGGVVSALVEQNISEFKRLFPGVGEEHCEELPLFPNWGELEKFSLGRPELLTKLLPTENFHLPTHAISRRVEAVVRRLDVRSERTGERLRVFPIRLRRNLATRAARQGYGSVIIAELLDHTDDQNARVYTENVPEHVDAINEAVARQLAPIAQAFSGVLVDRESLAIRGQDPTSRVRTGGGSGVGTCGMYGFCGALAPIACYTCRSFQPWLDAPHQEVMDGLLHERERIFELTRDDSMAAINDRTILAVAEVVRRCEERREQLKKETADG